MLDITSLQPVGDTLADLEASLGIIAKSIAENDQKRAELEEQRTTLLLTGTTAEIVELDVQIAKARVDSERAAALRTTIQDRLPAARQAAEVARVRAMVAAADAALAEVNAALPRYAAAAAVIAEFAALDRARQIAAQQASYAAGMAQIRYQSVDMPTPLSAAISYADRIQLPGIAEQGDNGADAVRKAFWPRHVPAPAAPAAPPKIIGPARFTAQSAPRSYEVRQPGTPTPPAVEWRTLPDYGAAW